MGNSQQTQRRQNLEEEEDRFSFTCEICIETTSNYKKFNNNNLCKHPLCVDCIAKYAETKIKDDKIARIQCPGLDCKQLLDPLSCRPIIPTSLFSQWCDLLFVNSFLGFERSFCPNIDCMELVVNECGGGRGRVRRTQCPNCKQWFCFQCKVAWHNGYQCEKSKELRDLNDMLFGQLAEKMTRARCPGCGHGVERKNNCRTIICRCETRFCYDCGGMIPCVCNRKEHREAVCSLLLSIGLLLMVL